MSSHQAMKAKFLPCGDSAFSVQFGETIERSLSEHVLHIKAAIDAAGLAGVVEAVPSYRALMIHYDPLLTTQAELITHLEPLLERASDVPLRRRAWRIPVCYDPEFAPDIEHVATWAGMSVDRLVDIHGSTTHYVYMIGFAPGQPHMGDLPKELAIPRREDPRPTVEKGAILTATGLTVIYPVTNASGWHIIGRSPVSTFDLKNEPPCLLAAGDLVRFFPISVEEFNGIQAAIQAGEYKLAEEAGE